MESISIRDYSLYKCPLDIEFSKKLNIIYGTNGTGKSTLLMLILFSIVGLYRGSIRTQMRLEKRRDSRPLFREDFFSARSTDNDKNPVVTAAFTVKDDHYEVEHSLKDGRLLSVSVNSVMIPGQVETYKKYEDQYSKVRADVLHPEELEKYLVYQYHERLRLSTGLPGGINTLINMLLNVMFFDEGRKLTFWDKDLQETVIGKYIVDAEFYDSFIEQKLSAKAMESAYKKKSETFNYMRKFFTKEYSEQEKNTLDSSLSVHEEIYNLEQKIESLTNKLKDNQNFYKDKNNELIKVSHEEETIRDDLAALDELWYKNLLPSQYGKYYNRFSKTMSDGSCPLCGKRHDFKLTADKCIMCYELLELENPADMVKIDLQKKEKRDQLLEAEEKIRAIERELERIKNDTEQARKEINSLNIRHQELIVSLNPDEDHFENSDQKRLEKAMEDRNQALKELNAAKKKEEEMRDAIEEGLVENFSVFREAFIRYARFFFGDEHEENLSLPFKEDDDLLSSPLMRFELDGKIREEDYMLSESQRIFTDLAFRLTVLTTFHDYSFFICETPDSTLDIFHEANAVKTFLEYICNGNTLYLSANARYSNLVADLYRKLEPKEVMIIDLTQLSKLALPVNYSFESYLKEHLNHEFP